MDGIMKKRRAIRNGVSVDVIVTRWQEYTGKEAMLDGDGRTFAEIKAERVA